MSLLRIVAAIGALLFAGVYAACVAFDPSGAAAISAEATISSSAQTCMSAQLAPPAPPSVVQECDETFLATADATTETEPLPGVVTAARAGSAPAAMRQRATSVHVGRKPVTARLQC